MAELQFYTVTVTGSGGGADARFVLDDLVDLGPGDFYLDSEDLVGTDLEGGTIYTDEVTSKGGSNAETFDVIIVEAGGTLYYANANGGTLPTELNFPRSEFNLNDAVEQPSGVVACFTAGTMIRTVSGEVAVEDLVVGDMVMTADHGAQPVRWVGRRRANATRDLAPVRIKAGALGEQNPAQDLLVSPWHRVLVSSWKAQALYGESEVLIPARDLVNDSTIRVATDLDSVEYVHVMFDQHEIIFGNGAPSESFHPADIALDKVGEAVREEILTLFPELASDVQNYGPAARTTVTGRFASALR